MLSGPPLPAASAYTQGNVIEWWLKSEQFLQMAHIIWERPELMGFWNIMIPPTPTASPYTKHTRRMATAMDENFVRICGSEKGIDQPNKFVLEMTQES